MPDGPTSMIGMALKRCADIENELADRPRPRDPIDRIIRAQLLRERRRRFRHGRALFWQIAKQAGLDPDWAKKEPV